ncbi:MAG: hypothetical protein IMY86_08470, partial [Chloroflexi bacterium]|nr:hypothetical protein [Chloroflexota bacterium]
MRYPGRWNRIRRAGPARLLCVALHRVRRKLFSPRTRPARWDVPLPDLVPLRALVPPPTDPTPILTTADDACAGCFTLLGFPTFDLGFPPDWHTDPHSGHHWDSTAPARVLDLMTRDSS